jgi:hypothetical protein
MEKVWRGIVGDPSVARKLLIGGVIFYLPIVNLMLLGYGYRYLRRINRRGDYTLPSWENWQALLSDSVRAVVPWLLYCKLPLVAAAAVSALLFMLFKFMGLLLFSYTLALLPLALMLVVIPAVCYHAMQATFEMDSWVPLKAWQELVQAGFATTRNNLPLILMYYGVLVVGWPLIGFAWVFGTAVLIGTLHQGAVRGAQGDAY